MKDFWLKVSIVNFAVVTLLVVSCEKQLTAPVPTMDRSGIPILITIHYVETSQALNRVFAELGGAPGGLGELKAFSQYNEVDRPADAAYNWCDVWAVRPGGIDDDNVLSLGHEIEHCTDGDYHD